MCSRCARMGGRTRRRPLRVGPASGASEGRRGEAVAAAVGRSARHGVASIHAVRILWCAASLAVVGGLSRLTMHIVATSPGFSEGGDSTLSHVALVATVALLAGVGVVHRLARPAY